MQKWISSPLWWPIADLTRLVSGLSVLEPQAQQISAAWQHPNCTVTIALDSEMEVELILCRYH